MAYKRNKQGAHGLLDPVEQDPLLITSRDQQRHKVGKLIIILLNCDEKLLMARCYCAVAPSAAAAAGFGVDEAWSGRESFILPFYFRALYISLVSMTMRHLTYRLSTMADMLHCPHDN